MAAAKEAKLDGKSAKGSGKGNGKANNSKGKKTQPKKVKAKAKAEPKDKETTNYSASKAKYIEEFLVSNICKQNWCHVWFQTMTIMTCFL